MLKIMRLTILREARKLVNDLVPPVGNASVVNKEDKGSVSGLCRMTRRVVTMTSIKRYECWWSTC